jgi:hypothetical protein
MKKLSPDQFDRAIDRASCPSDHARPRFIIHTPGFYDEGPGYGRGFSTIACSECSEDVARVLTVQYGGWSLRAIG